MRVLVLGASGMLGSAVLRVMAEDRQLEVVASVRSHVAKQLLAPDLASRIIVAGDLENHDVMVRLFSETRPQLVVNCIGLVKQLAEADDPLLAIPINALLPHRLARLCGIAGCRLVHVSTDCVFSGAKGAYTEDDFPDAQDLYGRSKLLGEVCYANAITLRTSVIGHELASSHGLIDWFLSRQGHCTGYTRAIFSGLPTFVLARIIRDILLPRPELAGVYHVAAAPIGKFDLLRLVADVYGKDIDIAPDARLVIDRSLNADRFAAATGYRAPAWPELIATMHDYYRKEASRHV